MEPGFEQANSNNLPTIDFFMVNDFFVKSSVYQNAEVQNVKMKRAGRENYGDNAVGQVQIKREDDVCIIKARISPEHRVTARGYAVTVVVNENIEEVINCECHDCTASSGGCKHAVAFLMWLHRRSEEPSVTDVTCYWKTSKLSKVGKTLKGISIGEMFPSNAHPAVQSANGRFRQKFLEEGKKCESKSLFVDLFTEDSIERVSLHCLSVKYKKQTEETQCEVNFDDFISFCKHKITEKDCLDVHHCSLTSWGIGIRINNLFLLFSELFSQEGTEQYFTTIVNPKSLKYCIYYVKLHYLYIFTLKTNKHLLRK